MAPVLQQGLTRSGWRPGQRIRSRFGWPAWLRPALLHREVAALADLRLPGMPVQLDGVGKSYGSRTVLHDIKLRIAPGSFVAVVGRSGSGKSTLLRLLAGLEQPDQGSIMLGDAGTSARVGTIRVMFQDGRLLPWKSVLDNVGLGLGHDAARRAVSALAAVGLGERGGDWPRLLSGGQKQRVALARALASSPRLLLLDEPLGALDALTRLDMQRLIERLWLEAGFTAVLVTHDVTEAALLADRILLIEDGRIGLDLAVDLARPRRTGPALAAIEADVLGRILHAA